MLSYREVTDTEKRMEIVSTRCRAKGTCAGPACHCCGPVGIKALVPPSSDGRDISKHPGCRSQPGLGDWCVSLICREGCSV